MSKRRGRRRTFTNNQQQRLPIINAARKIIDHAKKHPEIKKIFPCELTSDKLRQGKRLKFDRTGDGWKLTVADGEQAQIFIVVTPDPGGAKTYISTYAEGYLVA